MNYKTLKELLIKALTYFNQFYNLLNEKLLFAWKFVLDKQSENKITRAVRLLIDNPATALALNTILFYLISVFLSGNGGIIGMVFMNLAMMNIIMFCVNIMGWLKK